MQRADLSLLGGAILVQKAIMRSFINFGVFLFPSLVFLGGL